MADPEPVPITRTREFWTLVGYAAVFGSVMGLVAYVFLAIVEWATDVLWTDTDSYGWFAGEPWWILLMGGVGLTIGIIRRVLRVQPVIPGLFDEIDERRVEPATVPRRVLVGFVSLIGGASVGPEAPLASIGGGLATWVSERRQEPESVAETNTLVAMAGAFGGLFSAPMISALLVVEAATPEGGRRRYAVTAIPVLIAATAGFAVYFALAQTTFVDVYQVPPYAVDLWDFVVAIPLGVLGALLAGLLGFTMAAVRKGAMRFRSRPVVLATLGGLALGVIAFALPLTRFAGAAELTTLLDHAPELGAALVIVLILAKILAVALSFGTGFYGGPIFPMIFIGGAAGVAVHLLIPGIPEGLAVIALFAAVPGAGASIPFTLTFLAAMTLTLASPAEAAPAAIATAVSYAIFTGFLAPKPHPTRPTEGPTPADG
jgi:H+/Cl- antiporter ClcA